MTHADHDPLAVEFQQVIEKLGSEIGDRAVRRGLDAERKKFEQLAEAAAKGVKEVGKQAERSAAAVADAIAEAKRELAHVTAECADVADRLEKLGDGELASAVNAKVAAIDSRFDASRAAVESVLTKTREAIGVLERQAQANSDSMKRAEERLAKALDRLTSKVMEAANAEASHRGLVASTTSDLRALGASLQEEWTKASAEICGQVHEAKQTIADASEALRPRLDESIAEADRRIEAVSERLADFEAGLRQLQTRLLALGIPLAVVCIACAMFAALRGGGAG